MFEGTWRRKGAHARTFCHTLLIASCHGGEEKMRSNDLPAKTSRRAKARVAAFSALLVALAVLPAITSAGAVPPTGNPATYTLDTHFDEGTLVNVNHDAPNNDQLQLDSIATPFNFIWVAVSSKGTVVKIDTNHRRCARRVPHNTDKSKSRQPVPHDRRQRRQRVGREPNQRLKRIRHGAAHRSRRERSVRGSKHQRRHRHVHWPRRRPGRGPTTSGTRGVATADDECIVHYTQVNSTGHAPCLR